MTLPETLATSERKFSALQRLKRLPKKHHEPGLSEVPSYALSQIDYGHTVDEDILGNLNRGIAPHPQGDMPLAWSTMPPPPTFQNAAPLLR